MGDRTSLPAIAFIGLGNMGAPMAGRLLDAGFAVRAHDVSPQARATFEQNGGTLAASAADAVKASDVCILMLPDSDVVRSVVETAAFLESLRSGIVVVDMGRPSLSLPVGWLPSSTSAGP